MRPEEQGLLLFSLQSRHSALWLPSVPCRCTLFSLLVATYKRLRCTHVALHSCQQPHKLWLYVDDLLAALLKCQAPPHTYDSYADTALHHPSPSVMGETAIEDYLIWCGWKFCFAMPYLHKLCEQVHDLLKHKSVERKALERCLGLAMCSTSIATHMHRSIQTCTHRQARSAVSMHANGRNSCNAFQTKPSCATAFQACGSP